TNYKSQESSILFNFNCVNSKKPQNFEKELRRAPPPIENGSKIPSTLPPWTLPTLLPLQGLPTLPPPDRVINELANFFFPRAKVNMSDFTPTMTEMTTVCKFCLFRLKKYANFPF